MAKIAEKIKCYGGPMHGEFVSCERDRFQAPMPRRSMLSVLDWDATFSCDLYYQTATYTIELFREKRGNAYREMRIAVIDGAKNILTCEKWEIEHDICAHHWRPYRVPTFFGHFESWFAWCAYRNDHYNIKHIAEEFLRA